MDGYLARVALFRAIPQSELKQLADVCELRRFRKGEVVFEEGQPATWVWIVKRGWVYLVKRTPQGGQTTIFTMTPDEAVCGISAFEDGTYSASAVAATDTQLIKFPAETFSTLLERHPRFAKEVLHICCHRIRHMAETISFAQAPVEKRLAHVLLRLRATFGNTVPIIHQDLARMAGTRWETSIRTISRLRRKGWLSTHRGKVQVLRPDQLRNLLNAHNGSSQT